MAPILCGQGFPQVMSHQNSLEKSKATKASGVSSLQQVECFCTFSSLQFRLNALMVFALLPLRTRFELGD
ncbi:hypothetical protein SLEP1_g55361 [Rubroshorea leprosula]|uniref:Uncharacterized protein n=1 Tax=Rubroshorea leprosula TaxID=152421 RepID=A0AAV5MJ05_9ROSI|nr:hypothetical protein SLEP1_g55361 [Rubroshorea leprosula]